MIFTKACGAGVWTGNKRHLGSKTGWKVKEAVESGAWEGWKHKETASVVRPPSLALQREAVTLLMEPTVHLGQDRQSQEEAPAGAGLRQEELFVPRPARWAEGRRQQTCAAACSGAVPFVVLLASASQASHTVIPGALTNPQLCRRENSGRHSLISAKGTQHKFTARSFNNYEHFHSYIFLLSHPFYFFWLAKYFKANLRCFNS